MVGLNADNPARDHVMRLMDEKDRIEREIQEQTAILNTNNTDMRERLVDSEGYPRNDIDVYRVRQARHRIICLQNDHKAIMKRIEQGLAAVHAGFMSGNGEGPSNQAAHSASMTYTNGLARDISDISIDRNQGDNVHCFLVVACVRPDSPACIAGLEEDDKIIQFGSVNASNFRDILQIQEVVMHSVNQPVSVRVKRNEHFLNLTLTPQPWSGRGLLGCELRKLENE